MLILRSIMVSGLNPCEKERGLRYFFYDPRLKNKQCTNRSFFRTQTAQPGHFAPRVQVLRFILVACDLSVLVKAAILQTLCTE